jgi:hypothetical protein
LSAKGDSFLHSLGHVVTLVLHGRLLTLGVERRELGRGLELRELE